MTYTLNHSVTINFIIQFEDTTNLKQPYHSHTWLKPQKHTNLLIVFLSIIPLHYSHTSFFVQGLTKLS